MKTLIIRLSVAAFVVACFTLMAAADPLSELKPYVETVERDCPACGWSFKNKGSNNKPVGNFKGVFEPGVTCPFCGGKGKLFDRIDWQGGVITAVGVATVDNGTEAGQGRLLAQQGAKTEAVRNAVAAVLKVRLWGDKPMPKSYRRTLKAFVKGVEVKEVEDFTSGSKPGARAVVTVPLWGAKSVTGRIFAGAAKGFRKRTHASVRDTRVNEDLYTEDTTIVVDVRGTGFNPHLFPRIIDDNGASVYDMTYASEEYRNEHGVTRYIYMEKEEKTFEELKTGLETGSLVLDDDDGMLAFRPAPRVGVLYDEPPADTSKKKKRRKKKKRVVIVKGSTKKDDNGTKVVVSAEDAKKMAEAEAKGGAKKKANVVVITDSRVAGKQGMLLRPSEKLYAGR